MIAGSFRKLLVALAAMGLSACATKVVTPPPPTAAHVDLQRYQGTWHEAARLPLVFQNGCSESTAEYRLQPNGTVQVINRCLRDGREKEVRGTATVLDPATNARLEVRFDTWFGPLIPRSHAGNYWILHVAHDYSVAVVGTPDRKNLWILARTLPIQPQVFRRIVEHYRALGFPTGELIVSAPQQAADR